MDSWGGEEEEGEVYGESNMETYNTICNVDSRWTFAVWGRKLTQGLFDNLEGRNAEGDGREVLEGREIGVPNGWFLLMFDRKQQNAVKQLSFN